jgi:hypothetical protein
LMRENSSIKGYDRRFWRDLEVVGVAVCSDQRY